MISFYSLHIAPKQDYLHSIHFHLFSFLYFKTPNQGYLIPFHSILFYSFLLLKYIPFHFILFHSLIIISFHSIPFPCELPNPLWTPIRSLRAQIHCLLKYSSLSYIIYLFLLNLTNLKFLNKFEPFSYFWSNWLHLSNLNLVPFHNNLVNKFLVVLIWIYYQHLFFNVRITTFTVVKIYLKKEL